MSERAAYLCRVLIVDDEPGIRDVLTVGLQMDGNYEVFAAEGGEKAMGVIEASKVDVVISDVRMPHGSGLDLLRWIQHLDREKPIIIMMSGFSDISAQTLIAMGARDFLEKPFEFDYVTQVLQRACESRRS